MKKRKKIESVLFGTFIIPILWLLGRTAQKYMLYLMDASFVSKGKWKEYFVYNNFDKTMFVLAIVALVVIIISKKVRK